jgi:hypothetical protein
MGEGFLKDPHLLFPHSKGFLPLCKLLSCKEQLLQLLNCQCRRLYCGRAGRTRRRGERLAQSEHGKVSKASVDALTYCKLQPDGYLLAAFT